MKLKEFNQQTAPPAARYGEATVNVSKNGVFSFSVAAVDLLKLKADDHVVFLQDEDAPDNWYITMSDKDKGFKLREDYGNKKRVMTNCSKAAKLILHQAKIAAASGTFLISREPLMLDKKLYWLIILSSCKK